MSCCDRRLNEPGCVVSRHQPSLQKRDASPRKVAKNYAQMEFIFRDINGEISRRRLLRAVADTKRMLHSTVQYQMTTRYELHTTHTTPAASAASLALMAIIDFRDATVMRWVKRPRQCSFMIAHRRASRATYSDCPSQRGRARYEPVPPMVSSAGVTVTICLS